MSQMPRTLVTMSVRTTHVYPRHIGYPEAGIPHCPHCEKPIERCARRSCNGTLTPEDFDTWGEGHFSVWVERDLDRNWTVAYRIVIEEERNVIGEVRVFPTRPNNERAGEWKDGDLHGIAAVVPDHGITSTLLRKIKPEAHMEGATSVADQFRDNADPRMFTDVDGDQVFEQFNSDGMTYEIADQVRMRNGMLTAEQLALAASQYIEAINAGDPKPFETVAALHFVKPSTIEKSWLVEARKRDLLTRAKAGEKVGHLTAEGLRYLERTKTK